MTRIFRFIRKDLIYLLMLSIMVVFGESGLTQNEESNSMKITEWLQIGPVQLPLPAFHEDSYELKNHLDFEPFEVQRWWPATGETIIWETGNVQTWDKARSKEDGLTIATQSDDDLPKIAYLATYISTSHWIKADLSLSSHHLLKIYLDGEKIAAKETSDEKEAKDVSHTLKLETGKHLLLIKALKDPQNKNDWKIEANLKVDGKSDPSSLKMSTSPQHPLDIRRLLEGPKVADVSISSDGELATVTIEQIIPPDEKKESWLELRKVTDGRPVQTFRGGTALSSVKWAPEGKRFAYTEQEEEHTNLWIVDLDKGTTNPILKNRKDFGSFRWGPHADFIIYSIKEKPEPDKRGVKRLTTPRDRWPWFRTRSYLYKVSVPEGSRQRLTAGALTTNLGGISPDGRKLLFSRDADDFDHRPYLKTYLSILDLKDFSVDTLWEGHWISSVQWSSDGERILLTGGPSMFGELGQNIPEGMIPNDYDTQAYLMDLKTRDVTPISREFAPSIQSAIWHKQSGDIIFKAVDGEYERLFRFSPDAGSYQQLNSGIDVVNAVDIADNGTVAAYYGSSASMPHKAYILDLKGNQNRLLADPSKSDFQHVRFGKVDRWLFQNEPGVEIEGRIYYPPDFDPGKKYPAIVYYYGGTSPVTRSFGGRYPKNLFAAQGYVVYVLQPSGAYGFGQKFSTHHVNDWGETAANDIITGTQKFAEAHPFVDKERIGCIGASYGGFMTMMLLTKTDIFAAGISHAGISALSSYWGEGYWGYLYSAVATANKFPWNSEDFYIKHSPLYRAENISTPLLLLHGDADTNVPPGESDQFYIALKLLNKEVEYVQVADQNHHILDHKKRIIWQKTILAWFDKWLREKPEWWQDLYSEK